MLASNERGTPYFRSGDMPKPSTVEDLVDLGVPSNMVALLVQRHNLLFEFDATIPEQAEEQRRRRSNLNTGLSALADTYSLADDLRGEMGILVAQE